MTISISHAFIHSVIGIIFFTAAAIAQEGKIKRSDPPVAVTTVVVQSNGAANRGLVEEKENLKMSWFDGKSKGNLDARMGS